MFAVFFFDSIADVTFVLNVEGEGRYRFVFVSKAFEITTGLPLAQVLGRPVEEIIPEPSLSLVLNKYREAIETMQRVVWQEVSDYPTGQLVGDVSVTPVPDEHGRCCQLVGVVHDLTKEKQVEAALRAGNERFAYALKATTDAIYDWDVATDTLYWGEGFEDLFGYKLVRNPAPFGEWSDYVHPDDSPRVVAGLRHAAFETTNSFWQEEYRFKCADGNYKHMHDKGYVVYENGLPVKMIGSLQDKTGLKALEDQLMEEKLQRQKEISETVIRVQEKERTRIGHELHDNVNQILSTVKLFIDMLTPAGQEEKEIKKKSLDYIVTAIDEIRKLSKELVEPQLNQNGLVASIDTLVEDIHLSTCIKIKFTHNQENDLLSPGKKVTLFRIIQEQLKNILKHSKANQVDINLQSTVSTTNLTIRDNGIGFDLRQTHRGIGLSNIYERTRFYNGSVDIQTTLGKGCCLNISIPVL